AEGHAALAPALRLLDDLGGELGADVGGDERQLQLVPVHLPVRGAGPGGRAGPLLASRLGLAAEALGDHAARPGQALAQPVEPAHETPFALAAATCLPLAFAASCRRCSSSAFCGSSSGRPASMNVSARPMRSSERRLPRMTMRSTTPGEVVVPVSAARSGIITLPMGTAWACT